MASSMEITPKYITKTFNNIDVKFATIDADYIGWKYTFPTNNDHVIVYKQFLETFTCGRQVNKSELDEQMSQTTYITRNPVFHICKWDTFYKSILGRGYMIDIIVIEEKETYETILKILHEFVKDLVDKSKEEFDETLLNDFDIGEYNEYVVDKSINFTEPIEFKRKIRKISNYIITPEIAF